MYPTNHRHLATRRATTASTPAAAKDRRQKLTHPGPSLSEANRLAHILIAHDTCTAETFIPSSQLRLLRHDDDKEIVTDKNQSRTLSQRDVSKVTTSSKHAHLLTSHDTSEVVPHGNHTDIIIHRDTAEVMTHRNHTHPVMRSDSEKKATNKRSESRWILYRDSSEAMTPVNHPHLLSQLHIRACPDFACVQCRLENPSMTIELCAAEASSKEMRVRQSTMLRVRRWDLGIRSGRNDLLEGLAEDI